MLHALSWRIAPAFCGTGDAPVHSAWSFPRSCQPGVKAEAQAQTFSAAGCVSVPQGLKHMVGPDLLLTGRQPFLQMHWLAMRVTALRAASPLPWSESLSRHERKHLWFKLPILATRA